MAGMKRAAEQTAETSREIKEQLDEAKEAVIGFLELMAVDWFVEQIDRAFEYAESIKKVEEQTGLTTTAVQQFMFAASQAGVATDASQAALVRFTKSLGEAANGNQKLGKTFHDLGVTSTDPNEAMRQFAEGLEKVPTKAQKVADVTDVFGRSAAGLVPVLEEGTKGLDANAEAAQQLGVVMNGELIEGAVQAEHKISALKMVVSAEWASVIAENASAVAQLATAFMQAAGAAAHFFEKMNVSRLMSFQTGNRLSADLPTLIAGRIQGKSFDDIQEESRAELKTTHEGRQALYDSITTEYNEARKRGVSKTNDHMMALQAEHDQIAEMEARANRGEKPEGSNIKLPPLKTKKTHTPRDRSPQQKSLYDKALGQEQLEGYSLQEQLAVNPEDKAALQRKSLGFEWGSMGQDGKWQGGLKDQEIDDNLNAGKYGDKNSALAKSRADELKKQNDLNAQLQYQVVDRKLAAQLAAQELSRQESGLQNQIDLLNNDAALARTSERKKAIQDQIIAYQFQQQKLELEATVASKESTDAQKKEAAARLALLPKLEAGQHAQNAQQNMGPMAAYLDGIPKTVGEINESLQTATVDGLGKFTSGIEAAVEGTGTLGDAFKDLSKTIIEGIEKIVIEEAIIKPLGGLLSGALGSLGGGLGSLFKLPGHANGGDIGPGLSVVGERGPEVISTGSNAHVTTQAQLSHLMPSANNGGPVVNIGNITSNDPAMVQQLVIQGVAQAMPYTSRQASDYTISKANRRTLG